MIFDLDDLVEAVTERARLEGRSATLNRADLVAALEEAGDLAGAAAEDEAAALFFAFARRSAGRRSSSRRAWRKPARWAAGSCSTPTTSR
jgi:hypothetical protein